MNLLTSDGLKIFKKLKNIKLNDNYLSILYFDIRNCKLFKQIKIDTKYLNKIDIIKQYEQPGEYEFYIFITKYYMSLCNKLYLCSNLKNRCILLFMAYLDTINKYMPKRINYSLLSTCKNDYKIFNGNCWVFAFIYSKHHEILNNQFKIFYTFYYYLEEILKNPKFDNIVDLGNKLFTSTCAYKFKGFKKGKSVDKLIDIKNKNGILFYNKFKFNNLKDINLQNKDKPTHSVYLLNDNIYNPNFTNSITFDNFIEKQKNKNNYYYFIED